MQVLDKALKRHMNLRFYDETSCAISLDETTTAGNIIWAVVRIDSLTLDIVIDDVEALWDVFTPFGRKELVFDEVSDIWQSAREHSDPYSPYGDLSRESEYLTHPLFNVCRSEHEVRAHDIKLLKVAYSIPTCSSLVICIDWQAKTSLSALP